MSFGHVRALVFFIFVVPGWLSLQGCDNHGDEILIQPNVLLITVDTLRADRLSSYGYARNTSPNIDALAATGFRFTDAMTQWPKTWASIATLFTGTYPWTHGVRVWPSPVPKEFSVLSEIFAAEGYVTAAVVSNFNIGRTWHFDRGFDHFVESWQEQWDEESRGEEFANRTGLVKQYTNATLVTDQALRWLDSQITNEPFFLWLHYMDTHGPYRPPAEYADEFKRVPAPESKSEFIELSKIPDYQQQRKQGGIVIQDLNFYIDQYDREVRYLDDQIGRLLDEFESRKLRSNTIIVFTADHGESLGEHDYYFGHGRFPYQANAHVPLIFVVPDPVRSRVSPMDRKSGVLDQPVGLIDVAATLFELVGLEAPASFAGTSLVSLMRGERKSRWPEEVFMESGNHTKATQTSIRKGRYKLIHIRSPEDRQLMLGREFELYDLSQDPNELRDLSAERPELTARLATILAEGYESKIGPLPLGDTSKSPELDERSIDMLKQLGYVDQSTDSS